MYKVEFFVSGQFKGAVLVEGCRSPREAFKKASQCQLYARLTCSQKMVQWNAYPV